MIEWWRMGSVDPGSFAVLPNEDAVDVLWNLCSAHGSLVDLVRGLEQKRQRHVERVVDALMVDLDHRSEG